MTIRNVSKRMALIPSLIGSIMLAGVHTSAEAQSLGSATTPDGKVRVDITSLKRTEGETTTLKFQVTNRSNSSYSVTTANIRLIDIVGRRSYSPGLTSPSCSAPVDQKTDCYAIFGAPPATTQKISIQFYEKMDLITGIPIGE